MKVRIILFVLLVLLSACEQGIEDTFSSPENTILYIEKEIYKGNIEPYIERAYYSPYLKEQFGTNDSEAETALRELLYENFEYLQLLIENSGDSDLCCITVLTEEYFSDTEVYLEYLLSFTNESVQPRQDWAFFILRDDSWYLDAEPELALVGMIDLDPNRELYKKVDEFFNKRYNG